MTPLLLTQQDLTKAVRSHSKRRDIYDRLKSLMTAELRLCVEQLKRDRQRESGKIPVRPYERRRCAQAEQSVQECLL